MKQKNLFKYYKLIVCILLLFAFSNYIYAQESDSLEKIIEGNEFLLKSDFSMNIGVGGIFQDYINNINSYYFILYDFSFSYDLFNWLYFSTMFSLQIDIDLTNWSYNLSSIYFDIDFNEIFLTLPFNWNIRIGIFSYDLSIYSRFYQETPYYFGIAQFYIDKAFPGFLLNLKLWLIDLYAALFGIENSAAFVKLIFSFYDFAYISMTGLIPVNINITNSKTQFFIELALTTGLFDILAYFLPTTYNDLLTFCFGINANISFLISKSHNFKLKIFLDYIEENAISAFSVIDYINELNYTSSYSNFEKHPTRAGLGIEYNGKFGNNLSIIFASYFYYNISLETFVVNLNSKISFYYFYLDFNYFPFYYPVLDINDLSLSFGLNFSF